MYFGDNWTFDPHSITKYFRNQNPKSSTDTSMFTDVFFPANKESLMSVDSNGTPIDKTAFENYSKEIKEEEIEWKRASEIFSMSDFNLFEGKIEIEDIKQGKLGNTYFL